MECRVGTQVPASAIEESHRRLRSQSFGWLRAADEVRAQVDQIADFAGEVRDAGFSHVVVLGMGGAILPAEVIAFAFGSVPGWPTLVVLDTTDPAAIAAVEARIEPYGTLFVVADKTGQSLETAALHSYFLESVRGQREDEAGRQFVAITDEGSALEWRVHQEGMSALFLNDDEVPDGFSALSYFGMLPAALSGVDIGRLLARAQGATAAWRPDAEAGRGPASLSERAGSGGAGRQYTPANPAVELGTAIAELTRAGQNKLTIACSPGIGNFGSWIEGLMASSTGKQGTGVVPVDVEPLQAPEAYGDDRQFLYLRLEDEADAGQDEALRRLEEAGSPVHRLSLRDRYDVGAAFVLLEIAAATAAAALGVDPLAHPDVAEGDTEEIQTLVALEEGGLTRVWDAGSGLSSARPADDASTEGAATDGRTVSVGDERLERVLCELVGPLAPPDYVALQAWLTPANDTWLELQAMREALLRGRKVATSEGFAPRLLPLTGQLHKGGPADGIFVQFVSDGGPDLPVPGQSYSFARLKHAQSLADLQALRARGRRVLRVDVGPDTVAGLRAFRQTLERVLDTTACSTARAA